jgi:hypothetical protein
MLPPVSIPLALVVRSIELLDLLVRERSVELLLQRLERIAAGGATRAAWHDESQRPIQ